MGKYFGTDGIRGKAFQKLDAKLAFKLGQSLKEALNENSVVIGYDTRLSSPMLAHMIASGALTKGMDVIFAGVCSTPMIATYAKDKQITGVMVTASHNPYTDNGIKVFNKGYKTTPEVESIIEDYIDNPRTDIERLGTFELAEDFKENYLKVYDQLDLKASDLKLAYDSAHGANYQIAHELIAHYYPNSVQIGNEPDGLNINKGCGSTHMDYILDYVRSHDMDLGLSFDGDGDRLLICDQTRVYDGDEIIFIISNYLKQQHKLNKNHVVLTKMSNPGILKAFKMNNIDVTLTDVGDKYVSEALVSNDFIIGGENSGHVILRHLSHTGDGLLVAMLILEIMRKTNKSLSELTKDIKLYPYQLTNIKDVDKNVLKTDRWISYEHEVKTKLGDDSLLLVRPSGTEDLVRVTVSHENEVFMMDTIEAIVHNIKVWGEKHV